MPKLNDVYIEAGTAASAGEFISESLPNHTHNFSFTTANNETSNGYIGWEGPGDTFTFSSVSEGANNSVYQDGAKVHPDSVRYRAMVQITNSASDEALATCTSVLSDIASLKDANNFTSTGKINISSLAMPSDKYIDLTLGASGATYTAPANGWFTLNMHGTAGAIFAFQNESASCVSWISEISVETDRRLSCPAKEGDVIRVFFNQESGHIYWFRFVYAQGDQ